MVIRVEYLLIFNNTQNERERFENKGIQLSRGSLLQDNVSRVLVKRENMVFFPPV